MTILGEGARGTVPQWSGREVRALRAARRMSVRQFAAHLGVSDRMVSKWEAGGLAIRPRPVNQAALDTSLAHADEEVRARFVAAAAGGPTGAAPRWDLGTVPLMHVVRHPVDGKLMTLVEEGCYVSGAADDPVWLTGFYLDVYPTTNADYARFVAASGRRPPAHWTGAEPPIEVLNHPVVNVNWADAGAYAAWAGKGLPTGAEWEKAARGPLGLTYPWGDQSDPVRANLRESRIARTTVVDRYDNGVSPYGVYDLCGNVGEWCASGSSPGLREVRGGGYGAAVLVARSACAVELPECERRVDVGFRCAVTVDAMLELLVI